MNPLWYFWMLLLHALTITSIYVALCAFVYWTSLCVTFNGVCGYQESRANIWAAVALRIHSELWIKHLKTQKNRDKGNEKNGDFSSCLLALVMSQSAPGISKQLQCLLEAGERELRPDRFKHGTCLFSVSSAFRQCREPRLRDFVCMCVCVSELGRNEKAQKMIKALACRISS